MPPPTGWPPVLLNLDYATDQPPLPESVQDTAQYADGTLRITSRVPNANQGVAASEIVFRDVIIQAQVSLAAGADDDLYGLFLRSPSADLYYAFAVSPAGQVFVGSYDGEFAPLVNGPLDPGMRFAQGIGQPNELQVVAVGPSLTFILNGMLVTAEIVDERYSEGYLGFFVHHGTTSDRAELSAGWLQVRGIFPQT